MTWLILLALWVLAVALLYVGRATLAWLVPGVLGLGLWAFDVLATLRRQGPPFRLNPRELVRSTMLTSGAMTNRLDRLETQGLLRREADPGDRRGVRVVLTKRGLKLVDQAIEAKLREAMKTGTPQPLVNKDLLAAVKSLKPTTREWFATARNYALYSNQDGLYDDILKHLKM